MTKSLRKKSALLALLIILSSACTLSADLKWSYKLNDTGVPPSQVVADGSGGVACIVPTYDSATGEVNGYDILWLDPKGQETYKKHRAIASAGNGFLNAQVVAIAGRKLVYLVVNSGLPNFIVEVDHKGQETVINRDVMVINVPAVNGDNSGYFVTEASSLVAGPATLLRYTFD